MPAPAPLAPVAPLVPLIPAIAGPGEAVWIGDARSPRLSWANDALHEGWGIARTDPTLDAVLRRVHPADRARLAAAIERVGAAGPVELELRVQPPGAGWRDLRCRITPIDVAGPEGRYVAVAVDATERRAADETADLARLHRAVTLAARDVTRTRTEEELYERVCRVLVEQGGYRLALVSRIEGDRLVPVAARGAGADLVDLVGPADLAAAPPAPGDVATLDDPVAGMAGTLWAPLVARAGLGPSATVTLRRSGRPVATLLVAAGRGETVTARHADLLATLADDIGSRLDAFAEEERRRDAERRLEASEARYRRIVETTLEGIWILDAAAVTTYANARMATMLGWTPEEMVGRSLRDFVDDEGWAEALATLERRAAGISDQRDLRFTRRDGSDLWTRAASNPVYEGGRYAGTMAVISDISDQREREAELARAYDQRRRLIDRLVRAQEQERTRIAREVHDDSVQVMAAAAILVELLRDAVPDPAVRGRLDDLSGTVRSSIDRLRLLLFDLHPAALDRRGLAAAIRQLGQERTRLGAPPLHVVDESRTRPPGAIAAVLFRIAQDAISNVIKHADATSITVTIRTRHGGTALSVADDGRGIEPAVLRRRHGTPGIVAMRERAELAGGRLTVSSEPGRGAHVEAWVPNDAPGVAGGAA